MFNLLRVYELFETNFSEHKDNNIGIYGMGNNAKAIMQYAKDFNIQCVIVQHPNADSFYGKPVVSIEEAIERKIEVIILAAEPDIEIIIFNRIREICLENGIRILGLHLGDIEELFDNNKMYGYSSEDVLDIQKVKELIKSHDIISFDIFDTLLARKTLIPQDTFLIIEDEMPEYANFQFNRFHAELTNQIQNPTFDEIFDNYKRAEKLSDESTKILKEAELDSERRTVVSKRAIVSLLNYAKECDKKIYLVTDMYLPKTFLEELLDREGITGYEDIIISSEYRTNKNEELFSEYMKISGKGSHLHIGDHKKLDGLNSIMHGLDVAILPSALDKFKESPYKQVLSMVNTSNERSLVGMFMTKMFSDPFESKHVVKTAKEYGYLFLGPVISAYMTWLLEEIQHADYSKILFAARDGYLFQRLYDAAVKKLGLVNMPDGVYFYTSRKACLRSHCKDSLELKEIYDQYTFSVDDVSRNFAESDEYDVLSEEEIYKRSNEEFEGYGNYINGLNISKDENLAIVDLVSGGTCQYYLKKLFFNSITGFYLCRGLSWIKCPPIIKSFFREHPNDPAGYTSKIEQVTLLESVMTSPEPSLAGFSKDGTPKFLTDRSSSEDKAFVKEVQDGIAEFFDEYITSLYVKGIPVHVSVVKELLSYRNITEVDQSISSHIHIEDELLGVRFGKQ